MNPLADPQNGLVSILVYLSTLGHHPVSPVSQWLPIVSKCDPSRDPIGLVFLSGSGHDPIDLYGSGCLLTVCLVFAC